MLTNYIKRVLWGGAVRLSYIQDAWCLKVNTTGYRGRNVGVKGRREWRKIHTEEHRDLYYKPDQEAWDEEAACATCGEEKCVLKFDEETSGKRP